MAASMPNQLVIVPPQRPLSPALHLHLPVTVQAQPQAVPLQPVPMPLPLAMPMPMPMPMPLAVPMPMPGPLLLASSHASGHLHMQAHAQEHPHPHPHAQAHAPTHLHSHAPPGARAPRRGSGIQCANCGGMGHVYRICNHPITSFGVICFRVPPGAAEPEYLLVQRKDSLAYTELIRGKYNLQNRCYLLKLFSNMTPAEREQLLTSSFDELWYSFWQTDQSCTFMKEYQQSRDRFNTLLQGYYLRSANDPKQVVFVDLASAVRSVQPLYDETEWGFPKGRRNIDESDMCCACREFHEETGVEADGQVQVLEHVKPFEEVFTGSNRVRYRHVYYLARASPTCGPTVTTTGTGGQSREIRRVEWFDAQGVLAHIRDENIERRELFRRVHAHVLAMIASPPSHA